MSHVWLGLASRMRLCLILLVVGCGSKVDEHPTQGNLPVSICAAYEYQPASGAVVIEPDGKPGQVMAWHGHPYTIQRSDCLVLPRPTIRWIASKDDQTYIGLGDSEDIGKRSQKRMSQSDAIFAGDDLISVSVYHDVMGKTLWLGDSDRAAQAKLFEKLTGARPPR